MSKWPGIPILEGYRKPPCDSFWKFFPNKALTSHLETKINVRKLADKIEYLKEKMTMHEYERAIKADWSLAMKLLNHVKNLV